MRSAVVVVCSVEICVIRLERTSSNRNESVCPSFHMSVCFVYLSVRTSVDMSVQLSSVVCPSIRLLVSLFVYRKSDSSPVCLSVWLCLLSFCVSVSVCMLIWYVQGFFNLLTLLYKGLIHLTALVRLNLSHNTLMSLDGHFLSKLNQLQQLNIDRNQITSLEGLQVRLVRTVHWLQYCAVPIHRHVPCLMFVLFYSTVHHCLNYVLLTTVSPIQEMSFVWK